MLGINWEALFGREAFFLELYGNIIGSKIIVSTVYLFVTMAKKLTKLTFKGA